MIKTRKTKLEEIFYANASIEEKLAYDLRKEKKKVTQLESLPNDIVEITKEVTKETIKENSVTGEEIVDKVNALELTPAKQIGFAHIKDFPWSEIQRLGRGSEGTIINWGDSGLILKEVTLAQITANQNDYELGIGSMFRLSSDASRTITGFHGGVSGEGMIIVNVGSNNIVLANQSASSGAINRIITGTGANITLSADDVALLFYDSVTERWRVQEAPGGTGGAGFTELTATGTVDGNNTAFTFTELPDYIVSDHAWYKENVGWTWNGGTLTATMTIPPSDDIWGFT